MLNIMQKNMIKKAIELKINRGEDVVNWLRGCKNIDDNDITELLFNYGIKYVQSLDNVKEKKYKELSIICQTKIEQGVDISIDGVNEHFSYNSIDQANIDDLANLVKETRLSQPYHADGGNCKLYSPSQIMELYIAQKTNKAVNTTYYNQLREMIKNEYVNEDDVDAVRNIEYGMELTGIYLDNYNAMIAQSKKIINAVINNLSVAKEG